MIHRGYVPITATYFVGSSTCRIKACYFGLSINGVGEAIDYAVPDVRIGILTTQHANPQESRGFIADGFALPRKSHETLCQTMDRSGANLE